MHPLEKIGLDALGRGWSILPCFEDKTPAIASWKKYQKEKAEPRDLKRWLTDPTKKPGNLAVITGEISGLVILDFDGPPGEELVEALHLRPHIRTGSGGYHVYFKHPGHPVKTLNGKAKKELGADFPGLDIRADGGYAIFVGKNESGAYEVLRDLDDLDTVDLLPANIQQALGLVLPPESVDNPVVDEIPTSNRVQVVPQGSRPVLGGSPNLGRTKLGEAVDRAGRGDGRNNTGAWLAQQLRDNGLSIEEAASILREYQEAVTGQLDGHGKNDPYTWDEASATLRGMYSTPAREPEAKKPLKLPSLRSRSLFDSMFSLGQLLAQPDKGWYLRDFLGPQELVMIAGQPGSGKTFLVLDLCMSLVLGRDWAKTFQYEAPETLRVAYFAGEGVGRLGKRVQALLEGHGVTLEEVGDRFQVFPGVPNLANLDDPNSVLRIVEGYRSRNLPFPQVIVVDTLARATTGSDENSSRDAGLVIDALDYLKSELGCSVIVVHHTGKDGSSERGSSALRGAVDALYKVVKTGQGSALTAEKIKDAEEFVDLPFSLIPIAESCCLSWGGVVQINPYLSFLRNRPGERLGLSVIHDGVEPSKSQQTARNQLDKLVSAKSIQTLKTPGSAQVWWVDPPKEGTIQVDFSGLPSL